MKAQHSKQPHCPGSQGWPPGTTWPARPYDTSRAICGACGKHISCYNGPYRRSDGTHTTGTLRAHRQPAPSSSTTA